MESYLLNRGKHFVISNFVEPYLVTLIDMQLLSILSNSRFKFFSLTFVLLAASFSSSAQGLRWMSESEYIAMEKASIELMENVPPSQDLSKWFPTPGDQGEQGSCVGWAVAYGVKSYLHAVERQTPPSTDDEIFSPAFVYNQINQWGCMGGSSITDALELMQSSGVATMADFPYDETDCQLEPNGDVKASATDHTIEGWKRVEFFNEGLMKTLLVQGNPVVIGMQTDSWFVKLEEGEVYRVASNRRGGGHALVVVGYDDRRGAYKVFNSWGTDWGTDGYGWIAYDLFVEVVREAYILENSETVVRKKTKKQGKPTEDEGYVIEYVDQAILPKK